MEYKKSILIVHNYYQIPGGEDSVVENEIRMLESHGHKIVFYSRNNSELREMRAFDKIKLPFSCIFNIRTYNEIKRIIKKEKIDIVHVHNTLSLISPSVYYAARRLKIPVVQTIHNFRLLCPAATFYRDNHICEECIEKGLQCAVWHKCYRDNRIQTFACVCSLVIHKLAGIYGKINYICLTEFNKQKLLSFEQIKEQQVYVKPNFVYSYREICPEGKRKNQYVFCGRIERIKGVNVLLEAWKMLGKDAPKLLICGIGSQEDWCKEYIKEYGLNAEMLGFLPNHNVIEIMADSKALILPTQWYEGFPMSIIESFSVGTPVVCSDLGNVGSVVEEGVSGCKFIHDSPKSLLEAIERCKNMSSSAYKKYFDFYTDEKNYLQLNLIYESLEV